MRQNLPRLMAELFCLDKDFFTGIQEYAFCGQSDIRAAVHILLFYYTAVPLTFTAKPSD
jgi:hypothetical protein